MKFEATSRDLRAAVSAACGVLAERSSIPILSHILIIAKDDDVTVRGTDLDRSVATIIQALVAANGEVCVNGKAFETTIRKLPLDARVSLAWDDGHSVAVCSGKTKVSLPILPSKDFPAFNSSPAADCSFSLGAAELLTLLDGTLFAVDKEDPRQFLRGIYLHHDYVFLYAVATDGHRLAVSRTDLPTAATNMPAVIIPHGAVTEAIKLLKGRAGYVQITVSDKAIEFAIDNVTLRSRLIAGGFPDYTKVIPGNNDKAAIVDTEALDDAANRVGVVRTKERPGLLLKLTPNSIKLSANSNGGSASDEVEAECDSEAEIGLNARYLADVLANVGGEQIQIKIGDATSPALFQKPGDESWIAIIMSMRI